jgi:DNA-binding PadR family transcriptional regulator
MPALFDAVRALDGPVGHGSLIGALSRLERLQLVVSDWTAASSRVYRLTILGRATGRSAAILKGRPA